MRALNRFFWEETKTRGAVYAFIAVAGISLATVRSLAFHKPESEVALELVAFILVSNLLSLLFYCARGRVVSFVSVIATPRLPLALRLGGLVACVILLCVSKVDVESLQARVANYSLQKTVAVFGTVQASSLTSDEVKSEVQKIQSIVSASTTNHIAVSPDTLNNVQSVLTGYLKDQKQLPEKIKQSAWTAAIDLQTLAYTREVATGVIQPRQQAELGYILNTTLPLDHVKVTFKGDHSRKLIFGLGDILVTNSTVVFDGIDFESHMVGGIQSRQDSHVLVLDSIYEGGFQLLNDITWVNVEFRNTRLEYSRGRPIQLRNVTFTNCDVTQLYFAPPELVTLIVNSHGQAVSYTFEPTSSGK